MKSYKVDRVQQILLEDINSMITLRKLRDPRINTLVMVMHVKAAPDISNATVYVSGYLEFSRLEKVVQALNHARGYIQSIIAKKYRWRNTPRLFFKATDAITAGSMVIETITMMHNNAHVPSVSHSADHDPDTEVLK